MRNMGRVPPTLLLIGADGPLMFIPENLADEHAKDDFATNARLLCIAHAATACVMALEAWAKHHAVCNSSHEHQNVSAIGGLFCSCIELRTGVKRSCRDQQPDESIREIRIDTLMIEATPAADVYRDLIFRQWWARWQGKADAQGRCEVRVFFGKHRVTAGGQE